MAAQDLVIERLHVQTKDRAAGKQATGPAALRVGLHQSLEQVRLSPAYLSPHAILVIRTMQSSLPVRPSAAEVGRWRQQVERRLGDLARAAVRPSRQPVPPDAVSVLFDDPADLLLCYTRDVLAGRRAWYWAELFPASAYLEQTDGALLATAWLEHIRAVPPTLAALREDEAIAALQRLDRTQISRLAHSLHAAYDLPRGALDAAVPDARDPFTHADDDGGKSPPSINETMMAAPWQGWLSPRLLPPLSPSAAYLLGLSYALVKRPQQARQPAFARQARSWLKQAMQSDAARAQPAPARASLHAATGSVAHAGPAPAESAAAPFPPTRTGSVPVAEYTPEQSSLDSPIQEMPRAARSQPAGAAVFTQLGGAIFLINLMTRLCLPESIPALVDLNPWELLGGLAVALLGARADAFANDPLWTALRELAGLDAGQRLGETLAAADARDASGWPEQMPNHSHGSAHTEWSRLAGELLAPNLAWRMQRLRPHLRQVLAEMIGDPGDPADVTDVADVLLCQPARLVVSRTHVDVLLSVEQIRIPLRRAGLDRSPGWLPDFGYIVTIHFE